MTQFVNKKVQFGRLEYRVTLLEENIDFVYNKKYECKEKYVFFWSDAF